MSFGRRKSSAGRKQVDEHRAGDPAAARLEAIGMLARREYASGELVATLLRKGFQADAAAIAVSDLADEGLLNDVRYANSLVRVLAGRGQGPHRVRQALNEVDLPGSLVEEALAAGPDWGTLAAEVRQRKFGADLPTDWPERARQMRFLQYRGFSKDHIGIALGGSGVDQMDP